MSSTNARRVGGELLDGAGRDQGSSGDDPRVLAAVQEYLALLEAGRPADRGEFAARYPEFAGVLKDCLEGLAFVQSAAPRLSDPVGRAEDGGLVSEEPLVGTLGDFRLLREVGRGGMGVVYEAEQVSLRRRVALKVLPMAGTLDPRALQRFQNEARAAACLHHTNIAPVYFVGSERGMHFYAMQFIDGQTLAALIGQQRQADGPVERTTAYQPPEVVAPPAAETVVAAQPATRSGSGSRRSKEDFRRLAELGVQAAEALDHAHQAGIVHRDIKPANLMLDVRGVLWVTDFGLAHVQHSEASLTMTGDLVGTLRYMSPEQALAKRVVIDHRTDVYSLGATLYELLTLRSAFDGKDRQELLRQIAFEEPPRPRRLERGIPAELETIVLKAMEKNPAERYATAQELADDLERFVKDEPIRARRPSLVQRARKWARRHKPLVRATAALLLVLVLLGGGLLWREQQQRAALTRAVEMSLDRAEFLQQQEQWEQALAVLEVAEGQLEGHGLAALRERVQQRKRDVEMLKRLENVRLQPAAGGNETWFDDAGADRLYAEAFAWYGLEVTTLPPEEAAERVRASAISPRLIAGLADWAKTRDKLHQGSGESVRAVANLVDDDPWRRRLRGAARGRDGAALERLAEEEGTMSQPAANLVFLADLLEDTHSKGAAAGLLRRAQKKYPADFWVNFQLASLLVQMKAPDWAEVIRFNQAALALRPQSPVVWNNLGNALANQNKLDDAVAAYRKAIDCKPDFAAAYHNLGNALYKQKKLDKAIAAYRKAIDCKPDFAAAYHNLGNALYEKKKLDEAVDVFQKAIDRDPNNALVYNNLGNALLSQKKLDDAVTAYHKAIERKPNWAAAYYNLGIARQEQNRLDDAVDAFHKAIACDPDDAERYYGLGNALREQRKLDKAVDAYHKAIERKPDYSEAYNNLGITLYDQNRLDDAVAAYHKAIIHKPGYSEAYCNLGNALAAQKKLDDAITAYHKAIERQPNYPEAYYNLGIALVAQGKLTDAEAAYRKTIELQPEYAEAHCNLGDVLLQQGRFAEALAARKRGHALGSKRPDWHYPSADWVRQAERLVELEARLPRVLKGEAQPADVGERLTLAEICHGNSLYAAAARFFADAFRADPKLADDLQHQPRYEAACAAALAGCGQGKDAVQTDARERARLRRQALDWLRADLAAYRRDLDKPSDKVRAEVVKLMQHWQQDTDFAGVRGKALEKLPEAERKEWQKLWHEVEELRKPAANPPKPASPGRP